MVVLAHFLVLRARKGIRHELQDELVVVHPDQNSITLFYAEFLHDALRQVDRSFLAHLSR